MDITLKLCASVVFVTSFVVLVAVLGLLSSMPELPKYVSNDVMCLPIATETHLSPSLECELAADLLHRYIQKRTERENTELQQKEVKEYKEAEDNERPIGLKYFLQTDYWEMKPSARFTGAYQKGSRLNDAVLDLVPIREWLHGQRVTDNSGFRRYGIRYVNGRIVVPVAGTYQVYSFIDMYEPCIGGTGIPNVENKNQSIKHSIFKYNILDKCETELISSVQPHLKSANLYFNIYSSFISAVVSLSAGDELVVKVSNITYLKYPDVNYFGVNYI